MGGGGNIVQASLKLMILLTVSPSAGTTGMWYYAPSSFGFLDANGHVHLFASEYIT